MDRLFEKIASDCRKTDFLERVLEKAHYTPDDRELLWEMLEKILDCMEDGAGWSSKHIKSDEEESVAWAKVAADSETALGGAGGDVKEHTKSGEAEATDAATDGAGFCEVVMTLGGGVDELQERMLNEGKLTEAYMIEILGSEILLRAYAAYNEWVKENSDEVVRRYYFPGAQEADTGSENEKTSVSGRQNKTGISAALMKLEMLPEILRRSGLPVSCTEGYCMVPKKSVAFYAQLSGDRKTVCEGICMGCGRNDCPNRMADSEKLPGNRVLDRPLTYGYARILGL